MTGRVLFGALALTLACPPAAVLAQPVSQATAAAVARLDDLTLRFIEGAGASAQSGAADPNLLTLATERHQLLAGLMDSAPAEVLRSAVPASVRDALPAELRALTEEQIEASGTVEVSYEDYRGFSRLSHVLVTDTARYSLHFAGNVPDWLTGQQVRVRGVRVDQMIALDGSKATAGTSAAAALAGATGQQRTLVVLVNFQDKRDTPYTTADAARVVFTDTDGYFRENSNGATWLTGDVYGWYTIAMDSTVCDTTTLATLAKSAAQGAGATLSNYTRFVYAFPSNACTWWGLGSVGGSPSQAWINGDIALDVAGHELGHNLGLYHSRNMDCGATPIGSTCTVDEYGDTLDLMGATRGHYNAFQKERLGWLAPSQIVTLTTAASGTYAIEPYSTLTTGVKALKILKSTDPTTGARTYYYVEARQAIGYDSFMSTWTNVMTGVAVHTGSESSGNSSYLLDMTPETTSWYDPALTGSRTFTDSAAGLTLTTLGAGTSGATVSVTLTPPNACVPAAPRVAMTAASTAAVAAGTPVGYTLSVTNADASSCASSMFSLAVTVPTGWSAALGTPSLSLAPGATGSTTVTVTSPATAASGTYSFQVRALDQNVVGHDTSTSATYSVGSASTPPGEPRSLGASVSGNTATLGWQPPNTGGAASTYLVYVGTASGYSDVTNGYSVGNVLSVSGTLQRGTYYARVRAANGSGTSLSSNEVRFSIGRRLRTPTGFTVTWSGTTATLMWTASAADSLDDTPTSYVLEAGSRPGATDVARLDVGNRTVYRVEITSGTYYVRVRAQNALGESDPSEEIEVQTPGSPQAPTALWAGGSGATVDLRWNASAGGYPATSYVIEAGSAPGLSNIATLPVGNVTRFMTTAPPGVYYVRVRGVNARGASLPSNEVIVRR